MKNLITILCLFTVLFSNDKGDVMNKDEPKVIGVGGIFLNLTILKKLKNGIKRI